jgi:hypothetical protein
MTASPAPTIEQLLARETLLNFRACLDDEFHLRPDAVARLGVLRNATTMRLSSGLRYHLEIDGKPNTRRIPNRRAPRTDSLAQEIAQPRDKKRKPSITRTVTRLKNLGLNPVIEMAADGTTRITCAEEASQTPDSWWDRKLK